jgi:hypothetical protein
MMKKFIIDILTLLLPIGMVSFIMAFVKMVFIPQQGSAYSKAMKFFASAIFGIVAGYIASKKFDQEWVLTITSGSTLLADQIINYIDKMGLKGLLSYVKNKVTNTPTDNTPTQDGK